MSDGPEWFAPKRYGYGVGRPITWQGWAASALYLIVIVIAAWRVPSRPAIVLGVVIPVTTLFLVIASRTTRGGWRWRWGDAD